MQQNLAQKKAIAVDKSAFTKNFNLASLISDVDKLDKTNQKLFFLILTTYYQI